MAAASRISADQSCRRRRPIGASAIIAQSSAIWRSGRLGSDHQVLAARAHFGEPSEPFWSKQASKQTKSGRRENSFHLQLGPAVRRATSVWPEPEPEPAAAGRSQF